MPDRTRQQKPGRRRGSGIWQVLALAGLVVGIGSLFRPTEEVREARIGRGNPSTPPSKKAVASGYELEDVSARDVSYILAGIAASTALVIGIVFIMVWRFDIARRQSFSVLTTEQTAQVIPPAPHLQVHPFTDLARLQAREARLLNGYGWVNTDHTLARVPIGRAMALAQDKPLDPAP